MPFTEPPPFAAWRHVGAREGFEVVSFEADGDGYRVEGTTTGFEDGRPWGTRYVITLGADWATRSARITAHDLEVAMDQREPGRWLVDGRPAAHLDGCLDVDLESSALTNAFPVHRLGLGPGEQADAPAAYVRAFDLKTERLEQRYVRLEDRRYHYSAPAFGFECEIVYDESGLVLDYPGIATRRG
jgi:hypothetical protein